MRLAFVLFVCATVLALASIPAANGFPLLLGALCLFFAGVGVYESQENR